MWARPWLPSKPSSAPRRQAACPGASQSGMVSSPLLPGASSLAAALVSPGQEFTPDPGAVRAYQQINQVYATLTSHTDPLFRAMADGLVGLDRT